ncbi:hypothetical protein PtB15_18B332 [Puccinia triticina]|nr:hypothetical protein PtB15_18B332 [Puccinia triticina]
MRLFRPIQAGGRAIAKQPTPRTSKPRPAADRARMLVAPEEPAAEADAEDEPANFSGRPAAAPTDALPASTHPPTNTFLAAVRTATLSTLEGYRHSILASLAQDDPNGRIYSKNVRQMKDILAYERWRKKLDSLQGPPAPATPLQSRPQPSQGTRRTALHRRPHHRPETDQPILVYQPTQRRDHPCLLRRLPYTHRRTAQAEERQKRSMEGGDRDKRLFHIKNDGYWWESYSEVEEEGLLDDVPIEEWEKSHPSLFFICQLPHNKRSIQFLMQLISFIPNRNWLFQYGRVGMGFLGSGELCQRMTRDQSEKKYTRITAAANCLTTIKTPAAALMDELTGAEFFPTNLELSGCSSTAKAGPSGRRLGRPPKAASSTAAASAKTTKKIYKSSPEANPTAFAAALDLRPKHDVLLSSDEFECLSFLQRVMFIHSAQSWVEGISHAAAGAAILYDKLLEIDRKRKPGQPPVSIPKSKTPRSFSDQDWIVLAKEFNRWPFRPRSFENDLELDSDDGPGT